MSKKTMNPGAMPQKPPFRMDVLKRVIGLLFRYYRPHMICVVIGIVLASAAASMVSKAPLLK